MVSHIIHYPCMVLYGHCFTIGNFTYIIVHRDRVPCPVLFSSYNSIGISKSTRSWTKQAWWNEGIQYLRWKETLREQLHTHHPCYLFLQERPATRGFQRRSLLSLWSSGWNCTLCLLMCLYMLSCSQDPWKIHQTQKKQLAFQDTFLHPLCGNPSKIL